MLKKFEKSIVLRKTTFQIISWEYDLVWNKQDYKNQGFTIRWPSSCPLSMRWLKHKDDPIIHGKGERRVVLPVRCWRTLTWWNLDSFNVFSTYSNSTVLKGAGEKARGGKWRGNLSRKNLDSMRPWSNQPLFSCLLPWFN